MSEKGGRSTKIAADRRPQISGSAFGPNIRPDPQRGHNDDSSGDQEADQFESEPDNDSDRKNGGDDKQYQVHEGHHFSKLL
jgi:hypothetical protein